MKKSNLFFAMAAGAILVTSCASEQEMPNAPEASDAGKQLIVLSVANDNENTRGGRPLLSSEAAQNIDKVKLFVVNEQSKVIEWMYTVDNWNGNSDDENAVVGSEPYPNGRHTTIEIPKSECTLSTVEGETYSIYAIGYSDDTDYDLSNINAYTKDNIKDKTFDANQAIKLNNPTKEAWAEEIFAGDLTQLQATENGLKANLVLNRQVAGTYGYMNDIPYEVKTDAEGNVTDRAHYLHLVASNYNDQILLTTEYFRNDDHENDFFKEAGNQFYVNGKKSASNITQDFIYTIDLYDWFGEEYTELLDEEGNGTRMINPASWRNKTDGQDESYRFVKGSVFASSFIHPFCKTSGNTLTLLLTYDKEGKDVAKSWVVTLKNGPQIKGYTLNYVDTDGRWKSDAKPGDTSRIYNILRNHLYTIGVKAKVDPKDPTDPNDPDDPEDEDEDEDDPTPLNNKQEITIKVNSNWEVLHIMGLE